MIRADDLRGLLPRVDAIARDFYAVEWRAGVARCLFPDRHSHGDANPSLRFDGKRNRLFCASQQCFTEKGADTFALVQAVDGCDFAGAVQRLAERYAPHLATTGNGTGKMSAKWQRVAVFEYSGESRKVRLEHTTKFDAEKRRPAKMFAWEHLADGAWIKGKGGLPVPLYANRPFR